MFYSVYEETHERWSACYGRTGRPVEVRNPRFMFAAGLVQTDFRPETTCAPHTPVFTEYLGRSWVEDVQMRSLSLVETAVGVRSRLDMPLAHLAKSTQIFCERFTTALIRK